MADAPRIGRLVNGRAAWGVSPLPVLRAFAGLRRALTLYPSGHQVIQQAADELRKAVDRADPDSHGLSIEMIDGVAHLGGYPHRVDSRANPQLIDDWRACGVDYVEIERSATTAELLEVARILNELAGGSLASSLADALRAADVGGVRLARLAPVDMSVQALEWPDAPEAIAGRAYAETLDLARDTIGEAFRGGAIDETDIQRLLERVADELVDDSVAMAQVMAVKRYENYTFCHSVNVAALALLLGRRIGLGGDMLAALAEGALLHDIGKRLIPVEVLTKPAALTRRERRVIQRHPVLGAEILMETGGLHPLTPTVALEHHRWFEGGGGYPDMAGRPPHAMSQILSVVDIYEALTGARPYREPMVPQEACLILVRMAGEALNPALVRAFVSLISFYPVGSLVRTTRGEVGIVVATSADDPLHPTIELTDVEGRERRGVRIDTAARAADGGYEREIAETLRHAASSAQFEALATEETPAVPD